MIYKKIQAFDKKRLVYLSNSIFLLKFKIKNKFWNHFLENGIFKRKNWKYFHVISLENVSKNSWLFESY